jgi:hypothetical protein
MKSEERSAIKNISKNKDIETNLPIYGNSYMNAVYEYNMIRLTLNYYTMKEVVDEGGVIHEDEALLSLLEDVHSIIFATIINKSEDVSEAIGKLHDIRKKLTDRMFVLTAYTDALQIYEYILNRIEYGITGDNYEVDANDLCERVFKYLFSDNDKMVINSKIQMVTAQLPVRMTKSKFFDYLNATLNIYIGSDVEAVDDFVDMLRSTALLKKPAEYETLYPEIYNLINLLETTDYKKMEADTFGSVMEQFGMTTSRLTELVSNHLLAMEIVNALYSVLLSIGYQHNEQDSIKSCENMIKSLHGAFISESDIPSEVDDEFYVIEGRQEILGEDILQFESILPDALEKTDEISWMMAEKIFNNLSMISKLMGNSLFIDLDKESLDLSASDVEYINKKRDELVNEFTAFFAEHTKDVNRAVMGAVFSNMPVLFNSMQETKDYIEHSITACGNDSELMACAKILDEMMEEE